MYIVVDDPRGEWNEGSLVEESRARVLTSEGVALLPVDSQLFRYSGVGGYARRAWGSGISLSNQHPRLLVPMTLFVDQTVRNLNWLVRLIPDAEMPGIRRFNGILRLMQDSSQAHSAVGGLGAATQSFDLSEIGAPDAQGGWTLRGTYDLAPHAAGHMGIALYGTAPGLRVVWSAISASR